MHWWVILPPDKNDLTIRRIQKYIFFLIIAGAALSVSGQETFRLMTYNLLNYPSPSLPDRHEPLKVITDYIEPDLLMVCELLNLEGADSILNFALNSDGISHYERADFVPAVSAPWLTNRLQQTLFYNRLKFGLIAQDEITTQTRDINEYDLFLKEEGLELGGDTTFLTVYVGHLKASDTQQDENDRKAEVDKLYKHLNRRDLSEHYLIFAGDFNLYTSSEPAYLTMLNPAAGPAFRDPVGRPGNWNGNQAFAELHTQSPRITPLGGMGAAGGMDSRFDFIMVSENIANGTGKLTIVPDSYKAIGNDGTCFDQSILECSPSGMPSSVLNALHSMSDHLPVVLDLSTDQPLSVEVDSALPVIQEEPKGTGLKGSSLVYKHLNLKYSSTYKGSVSLQVHNSYGQEVYNRFRTIHHGENRMYIDVSDFKRGVYYASIIDRQGVKHILRFYKR